MKKFLICLLMILMCSKADAAVIEDNAAVAVMDFGTHKGTSDPDVSLLKAEQATSEYVINRLVKSNHFEVMDKDIVLDKLKMENLKITGLIDPDTARRIGEILGVDYIIYGNVTDVVLDESAEGVVKVRTVKANIVIRMMEIKTGRILMAAKGEGKSKSASVLEGKNFVLLGTIKVSQTSVHNALKKAAFEAVDTLVERLGKFDS